MPLPSMYGSAAAMIGNPGNFQAYTRGTGSQPLAAQPYVSPVSSVATASPAAAMPNYAALAAQAEAERQAQAQRAAARQQQTIGGYDQQITRSRTLGDQGYDRIATNYDAIAADAAATRDRNMARVDQYGNSMRQDLAIQGRQALAAASQSAIKRGLGNTTIQDSLVRGQNFDNARQQMSLEDQLLQNRISTDSNLSGAYQGVLQNRAQGLQSQWNQNIANDNQLAGQRLGYIGGIQEDMNAFNSVANIYSQQWQMENANRQAEIERNNANQQAGYNRYAQNPSMFDEYGNPRPPRAPVTLGMPRGIGGFFRG